MSGFQPGDVIYISKPYVYVLDNAIRGERCDYCFMKRNGLKRCTQCSFMYFCDRNCQVKAWDVHKEECKYIKQVSPNIPSNSVRLLANLLFKLKKYGQDEPYEIIHGHKMNFRRLMSHSTEIKESKEACQKLVSLLTFMVKYIGQVNIPSSAEFIEIFGKMVINSFSICDGEMQSIGSGIYLGASIFDHSCDPDAEVIFNGLDLHVRAVKKIPHKDVTKIYFSYIEQMQLTQDRQNALKEQYYFCCQCPRCTSSYYEDLMSKTLTCKTDTEIEISKFKLEVERLKELKKCRKVSSNALYETCMEELEKQDKILADTHILKIKTLEIAFDACIDNMQWADAITLGKLLIEPYKLLYGTYSPIVGIHLFKVGKLKNLQGLVESARPNLFQAKEILRVTHGEEHPLYNDLLDIINECSTLNISQNVKNQICD